MDDFLRFLRATFRWATALVVLTVVYALVKDALEDTAFVWPWLSFTIPANFSIFLPFTAFAGGIALCRVRGLRTTLVSAALVGLIGYGLGSYVSPVTSYLVEREFYEERPELLPFGPWTPGAHLRNLEYLEENPTADPESGSPLRRPANRLRLNLHTPIAFAILTVLFALLGRLVAVHTTGLSPPVRRNTRWALGLGNSIVVFLPWFVLNLRIIEDPSFSGILGAYGPLLVPLVELLALYLWTRRKYGSLHTSTPPSV
jgi:hypothetical protein